MTTLTQKFEILEEQLEAQDTAMQVDLNAIREQLELFNTQLDIMNINNAVNIRALLSAIGQNNPCMDCDIGEIAVPPTSPVGQPIDQDKCKRVQAFLHAMMEVFTVLDTMSAFGVGFNPTIIKQAIEQVITALANGDETPLPSFPEMVQIGGDGINYVAGNLLAGDTLVELFTPLVFDLRDAMYGAGSPNGAKAQYDGIINGSSVPSYAKPLMIDAAYNALYNYYLDPSSDPNLTGYSGTACSFPLEDITSCIDMDSHDYLLGPNHYQVVVADPVYGPNDIFTAGDFFGFTFEIIAIVGSTPMRLDYYDLSGIYQGGSLLDLSTGPVTMGAHTVAVGMHSNASDLAVSFTVRVCPPE